MNVILSRKAANIISILGTIATIAATIYLIWLGVLKGINALRGLVGQSTIFGPTIFMLIRTVQMIIPIIPGGVSCVAGALILGPIVDFVYNYAGITFGSIIIFLLGRNYGKPFIMSLVSDKTYSKYIDWLDSEKRSKWSFTLTIFFPIAPDDTLCLMAGLIGMSVKKSALIILPTEPASIYLCSLALICGGTFLTSLLGI